MTVKLLKQPILGQRRDPLMVSLDDTGYYYTRHWNISSTMFVMLLRFVLCVLLRFRKNTQLATVGTHQPRDLALCCRIAAILTVPFHVATVSWGVVGGHGGGGRCGGVGDGRGKVMLVVLMGGDGTSGVLRDVVT